MDETARRRLLNVYALIKLHDIVAARPLVLAALQEDRRNIDAWWLAVYTAKDSAEKRKALQMVLRLNPNHAAAQSLLARLDEREQAQPASPVQAPKPVYISQSGTGLHRQPKKNNMAKGLQIAGGLALAFMSFVIVDNFMGGKYTTYIDRLFNGQPEAVGWVAEEGGQADEQSNQGVPITEQKSVRAMGDMNFSILSENEAHTYILAANQGDEILVGINFTQQGQADVTALELWNQNGQVVAREEKIVEMMELDSALESQLGAIFSVRSIHYVVPQSGIYTIAVIGRQGGPRGNYTLIITDAKNPMQGEAINYTGR